jgi:hypothetical protein
MSKLVVNWTIRLAGAAILLNAGAFALDISSWGSAGIGEAAAADHSGALADAGSSGKSGSNTGGKSDNGNSKAGGNSDNGNSNTGGNSDDGNSKAGGNSDNGNPNADGDKSGSNPGSIKGGSADADDNSGKGHSGKARAGGALLGGLSSTDVPPPAAVKSRAARLPAAPTASAARVVLPDALAPKTPCPQGGDGCNPRSSPEIAILAVQPLLPSPIVTACRDELILAAMPFAPVSIDVVSAGNVRRTKDGQVAPLSVKIVYDRRVGYETRRAKIACRLNERGAVISFV